jgi:D-erythrose 4-phosphate dehydrogenase
MLWGAASGALELRATDGGVRVSGRFPYNVETELAPGRFEIVEPRAFAARIEAGEDVHLLSGHDYRQPLASRAAGSLEIRETDEALEIEHGVTTTIHSAMNDQPVIDAYHQTDLRLTRSAMHSIVPVDTSLARGIDRLMPHLAGRFECLHMRVPTINVSVMDLSICVKRETTAAEINSLLQEASQGRLAGLLGFTEEPMASIDFNHDPRSGIVDATQTRVAGCHLVKLLCWFDNEWGFANRMLDVSHRLAAMAVPDA